MTVDFLVIGGGAAGMMAAHTAALYGMSVLLLEKNEETGKKLRITGKGRCNLTNDCDVPTLIAHIPTNGRFLYSAASQFSPSDTMRYFETYGLPVKTERGNRVFPVSDSAWDVCRVFAQNLKDCGVQVLHETVSELLVEQGRAAGVRCKSGKTFLASHVLIATGGLSYPGTGSTGDGYALAKSVGHTIVSTRPSLVPLVTEERWPSEAMGLSLRNVILTLYDTVKKTTLFSEQGEMLFTHFGVSGPLVLSASAHIRPMEPDRYQLFVDLKPALSEKQLDARLLRDFSANSNRDFGNSLGALLPRKLIGAVVRLSGIPHDCKVHQITHEQRQGLVALLKKLPMTVRDFRPIEEAIVTSGGVDVREVSPKTMESKLLPGLYFAGEVLDLDAYTGGFNLQIAFSTAYAAAVAASGFGG